jgi:hypothetical protein
VPRMPVGSRSRESNAAASVESWATRGLMSVGVVADEGAAILTYTKKVPVTDAGSATTHDSHGPNQAKISAGSGGSPPQT